MGPCDLGMSQLSRLEADLVTDKERDTELDDELVNVYDKENPVIQVGKMWPSMEEFRMFQNLCSETLV